MNQPDEVPSPLFCDRCQARLGPGRGEFYVVKIEAMADPTPPTVAEHEKPIDYRAEIARLVKQLQHVSPQEAMDQVYRRLTLYLCLRCYGEWIEDPTG